MTTLIKAAEETSICQSKKSNPQHLREVNKTAQNRKKFERSKSSEAAIKSAYAV